MGFRDRTTAGRQLAAALTSYRDAGPVIIALPRGGVPIAAEIATELSAPLGVLVVRKLGVPNRAELAMGAVAYADPPVVVRNEGVLAMTGVSPSQFAIVLEGELAEAKRRVDLYMGARPQPVIAGHTAILVDDGMATGATMRAAIRAVRAAGPRAIAIATPVASVEAVEELRPEVDDVVCLEVHRDLGAIGFYYADFAQVSDREVIEALERAGHPAAQRRAGRSA